MEKIHNSETQVRSSTGFRGEIAQIVRKSTESKLEPAPTALSWRLAALMFFEK